MNSYIVVDSGRNIIATKTTIYSTYKEAIERRKVLLSYRSSYSRVIGITSVILKVQNGKII